MERPFIKVIAGKAMRFEVDGSVTDLSRVSAPAEKPAQKKVVEQVVEKAQEAVAAIEEAVKPKRRGRPKKKPAASE